MFNPVQRVLVYRPTPKVGLAEKLLHHWHGQRLKKLTDPIRLDQGLEQTDADAKETPSPSRETMRKSVRFEHHATKDDSRPRKTDNSTKNKWKCKPQRPGRRRAANAQHRQAEPETEREDTTPTTHKQAMEIRGQQPDTQPDSNGLTYAAIDKLSPALFQPSQLQNVISNINNNMPSGWTLTHAIQAGDMWRSYQEAKVTAANITDGVRLFIHTESAHSSQATLNGTTGLQYVNLPAYIAASPDQQMFVELTPEMIEPCRSPKNMICPISGAVSRKSNKEMCSVAIFLADDRRVQDISGIIITSWSGCKLTRCKLTSIHSS
uniref:Uncharacterized protein n=1 Tax=Daphnia galeata TaxID=27404 RepID=A0A8J2WPQ6_9CRUS|nr:unnamed protein product [Daphnia galeata]